jgi:hypothetical protein
MAKLCRIHVVGIGKESARFNPLTIDLRNPKDDCPQDSVIWLRNGGGKTTLISIFYSLLVPSASYFLGKMNGKGAALEDFLRPDQLAAVATEWDLATAGSPRRTVGQALLLKDRKFIRKYFSFSAVPSFNFDTLPIHGLGPAAKSLDKLIDVLHEAQRSHPAMDLVIEETQWRWEEHLANLGLDPGIFRAHLVMNSQEGGATEIFKIKTPEEFVRRFLELVSDDQSTEEIELTLKLFREKLAQNPSYRAAIEFGDGLLKYLRPFAQRVYRHRELVQEQETLNCELRQLATSVHEHLAILRQNIETLTKQVTEFANLSENKEKDRLRKDRFARGYDRRARRLRVHETGQALRQARETRASEERQLAVLGAAKALIEMQVAQAALKASLQRLEELRIEHRPELDSVKHLGAVLFQAWERRLADLQTDLELTGESVRAHEKGLDNLHSQRVHQTERRTRAETQRDQAQSAIRRYESARRKLKEEGSLNEGETGVYARTRWQAEIDRCITQLTRLKEEIAELRIRDRGTDSALYEIASKCREKEQERTELEATLKVESNKRQELETLPIVIELTEGKTPDLHNPFLLESLDSHADQAQSELVRLGVDSADSKRDDQSLEREGLFAPSTDTDTVLTRLKANGVTSALPVYRWLDEHRSPDEAADLLRRHPDVYAAILVQNRHDFERVRREIYSAHIRTPVVIVSPSNLSCSVDGDLIYHTVLPEERGLFSRSEAANARPRLEQRRQELAGRCERAEERRKAADSAATRLRDYLRDFPLERLASLRDSLEGTVLLLNSLDAEASRVRREKEAIKNRLEEVQQQQIAIQEDHNKAIRREAQISTFIAEHEERIDDHRKSEEYHQTQMNEADVELNRINQEEPNLKSRIETARNQILELRTTWELTKRARDSVPEEYRGSSALVPDGRPPEELAPIFYSARDAYEGKIQKGELEGEITVRRENVEHATARYDKLSHDLPDDEIAIAAHEHAIDVAIERQAESFERAKSIETLANSEYNKAQLEAPEDRDFKEGEELDRERISQPETSATCFHVAQEYRASAALLRSEIEDARTQSQTASTRLADQKKDQPLYENWSKQLPPWAGDPGHVAFTGVPEQDVEVLDKALNRAKSVNKQLVQVDQTLTQEFDKHIHPHIFQTAYDRFRIPFRDRLRLLKRDDFMAKTDEHILAIETHVKTCQNELNSEEQERRTIVEKLDGIARRATALFAQAETVSIMPDSIREWAQQPFLRVTIPKKNDPTERQVLLRQIIERWFETGEIPSGHKLTYECLLAVCGTKGISIRILKPEYHLTPVPRDITELVRFSDGEKLTAAILLYCVLVRLRERQKVRSQHLQTRDSGMLLLDNPFGKATLAEFVDLQLRMARQMGVQLIYATGINDFAALKHFPHYVRLRNSSRAKTSNDYHITLDLRALEGDQNLEGIALGRSDQSARRNS